ncbi:helix-turn-helix domain-containing protein [Nocardia transvalensis]|uniref:helix-turn-helix domain-containing protein n=1 Tax=Nocardia transvalensis TaxID=37333 RepID=UPI00189353C5|nr:helix-turn-helix domain-containing protein [Nocardia transvalensis]MBF6328169.1 XRE family transcriptional regulator [Nocardia transvalensis]
MLDAMQRGEESGPVASSADGPQPDRADSPAEYIAALRALRTWSGLTYRQLAGKAEASGNTLPPSTIATTLGRVTLPREPFVTVFTRACGLDDDQVALWLAARRRIALGGGSQSATHEAEEPTLETPEVRRERRSPQWCHPVSLIAAVALGVAGTLGVQALPPHAHRPAVAGAEPVAGLPILAVGSWARIRPARTPELCLTEGRDRTQRYPTAIAVQRPCTQAVLPRVYLEPLGEQTVQIQWHHPEYGIGCLTVLLDGPGRDLLEPRDDCADDNPTQRFRIDPVGPPAAAHFRIRPTATAQCLALRDHDTADGTEIVQGRCSGDRDQEFLINLVPPP